MSSQHGEERFRHSGGDHEPNSHGIHIKKSHEGLLHKELGVKAGHNISEGTLAKAKEHAGPAEKRRIVFAENERHWSHKG